MLTLSAGTRTGSRREFLRIGSLSLGGFSLAQLLARTAAAGTTGALAKDRSVVLLFLDGGPPQAETFDAKMDAPSDYRPMFGDVATKLAGVRFGAHFPRLAALADRLAIVRSFQHGVHRHGSAMRLYGAGGNPTKAHMGALYAHIAGLTHPETGMPRNMLVSPGIFNEEYKRRHVPTDRINFTGHLPPAFLAFDPSAGSRLLEDMQLSLPEGRMLRRRDLLSQLDRHRRDFENSPVVDGMNRFEAQAFDVIFRGVGSAFDITREDPRTIERYDTSAMKIPASVLAKSDDPERLRANFEPTALGKQLLLARRLVEAGCGFVTVRSHGWDMHGGAFNVAGSVPVLCPAVDKAASAFIEDIDRRGLSDKVLFIITGEFGRTPKINDQGGRDHWGNLCPLVFAGGGLRMGEVVGASDRFAAVPESDHVSIDQVFATIMHSLIDPDVFRRQRGFSNEVYRSITTVEPIAQLVG